jgi:transposase InsO family protein
MKTGFTVTHLLRQIGISSSKFYDWVNRYGQANEHNGQVPRNNWLEEWERQAIISFCKQHPNEGYRRMTYMMLDADVVGVSPTSVYRVLKEAGLLQKWNRNRSDRKGKGFAQPSKVHEHWHTDVSYLNIHGTFYYLCSLLDGYSRYIVHWEIRPSMTEPDVEIIIQRAREHFPNVTPRIISDNGPQFIAKDFKEFIRECGMTHVRTSPFYPQSNGKIERWHQSIKKESLRPNTPLSLEDARHTVETYVDYYNRFRLHSSIGYIAPYDKLMGNDIKIFEQRNRKLEEARKKRKIKRIQEKNQVLSDAKTTPHTDNLPLTETVQYDEFSN